MYDKLTNPPLKLEKYNARHSRFSEFKKHNFKMTNECITASDLFLLNEKFDAFVCGSDQIWSPFCFDSHFYLDFVDDDSKKIAYAPSIGTNKINNLYIEGQIGYLLKKFEYISIRENSGAEVVKKLTDRIVPVVLDPTMLITQNDWSQLENKINNLPEKYIFCYFLGNNETYWKYVYKLSKKTNLPLVIVPVYKNDFRRNAYVPNDIGPAEFLYLIHNAAFICTDSFHGSIFSIIFKKNMAVFKRFKEHESLNQNTRLETLLDTFHLQNRMAANTKSLYKIYDEPIDYVLIDGILKARQLFSRDFLSNALKTSTELKRHVDYAVTNTCCGCGACEVVCPENAVTVVMDQNGFMQFSVNQDLCTHCKKCRLVCPYSKHDVVKITKNTPLYAAYSKKNSVLLTSSSGGIGFELMNYYKEKQEAVAGCAYDSVSKTSAVKFINYATADEPNDDISKFQGSKYIQSIFIDTLKQIDTIEHGIITGLPCQISAAHNYLTLKKRRKDFLLVDLICHGVPSQLLWDKYINEKKELYGFKDNPHVIWRNKPLGWAQRFIFLSNLDKNINLWSEQDDFYAFFLAGNCYLPSCYECNYRNASCADIRIGDYWGPRYKNSKTGVSMVLPLTENGKTVFAELNYLNRIEYTKTDIKDYFKVQQTENSYRSLEYGNVIDGFKSDVLLSILKKEYCIKYARREKIGRIISCIRAVLKT